MGNSLTKSPSYTSTLESMEEILLDKKKDVQNQHTLAICKWFSNLTKPPASHR